MDQALTRRIMKETERLQQDPVPGLSAKPHEDNLRYFDVRLDGPAETPYEGGVFKLELFLTDGYPMVPPKVRFLTKIYHPNIDKVGRICLDILKDKWSPALQIRHVLLSIGALMSTPAPDDPLANDVAEVWKADQAKALKTAREWTRLYVSGRPQQPPLRPWPPTLTFQHLPTLLAPLLARRLPRNEQLCL